MQFGTDRCSGDCKFDLRDLPLDVVEEALVEPGPEPADLDLDLPRVRVQEELHQPGVCVRYHPRLQPCRVISSAVSSGRPRTHRTCSTEWQLINYSTSRSLRRRSCSSLTWRSKAARASASLSRRRRNSRREMWPGCGGARMPSGSCVRAARTEHVSQSQLGRPLSREMERLGTYPSDAGDLVGDGAATGGGRAAGGGAGRQEREALEDGAEGGGGGSHGRRARGWNGRYPFALMQTGTSVC